MQCVILAAGKGMRMRPLTEKTPKQLVRACNKTLLDHIVEALPDEIDELIIVEGYLGEQIREYCGEVFHGRSVRYVHQSESTGPADALWLAKDMLRDRFMVMYGDDIHGKNDLAALVKHERSMSVVHTDEPSRFGIATQHEDGSLETFEEKPDNPKSNLASSGAFVFDIQIFEYDPEIEVNGEHYLPEIILRYSKKHPVMVIEERLWIPVGYPEDIETVEKILCPEQ